LLLELVAPEQLVVILMVQMGVGVILILMLLFPAPEGLLVTQMLAVVVRAGFTLETAAAMGVEVGIIYSTMALAAAVAVVALVDTLVMVGWVETIPVPVVAGLSIRMVLMAVAAQGVVVVQRI
jgi:hypothetical protein